MYSDHGITSQPSHSLFLRQSQKFGRLLKKDGFWTTDCHIYPRHAEGFQISALFTSIILFKISQIQYIPMDSESACIWLSLPNSVHCTIFFSLYLNSISKRPDEFAVNYLLRVHGTRRT